MAPRSSDPFGAEPMLDMGKGDDIPRLGDSG